MFVTVPDQPALSRGNRHLEGETVEDFWVGLAKRYSKYLRYCTLRSTCTVPVPPTKYRRYQVRRRYSPIEYLYRTCTGQSTSRYVPGDRSESASGTGTGTVQVPAKVPPGTIPVFTGILSKPSAIGVYASPHDVGKGADQYLLALDRRRSTSGTVPQALYRPDDSLSESTSGAPPGTPMVPRAEPG
jgi:hypothetical protein